MKTIEDHIQKDKEILADPTTSEPMRHHIEDELHDLEVYVDPVSYTHLTLPTKDSV